MKVGLVFSGKKTLRKRRTVSRNVVLRASFILHEVYEEYIDYKLLQSD